MASQERGGGARTVLLRGLDVVDRARADDHHEAVIGALQHVLHGAVIQRRDVSWEGARW